MEQQRNEEEPAVWRHTHPQPGPEDKCGWLNDVDKKTVCGKPGFKFVTMRTGTVNAARVALCEKHFHFHNYTARSKR